VPKNTVVADPVASPLNLGREVLGPFDVYWTEIGSTLAHGKFIGGTHVATPCGGGGGAASDI